MMNSRITNIPKEELSETLMESPNFEPSKSKSRENTIWNRNETKFDLGVIWNLQPLAHCHEHEACPT